MSQPFRIAIIGAGRITAAAHLPAGLATTRAKVVALVDPFVERARRLAWEFGIQPKIAGSVHEVLGEIDGAVIATPNHTHCELALECLQAGVPVLIEKPLAVSVVEGEQIVRAADAHRTVAAVGYCFRFVDSVRLMRTLLDSRYFGTIRRFVYQFGTAGGWAPLSAYNLNRRTTGGGVLMVSGTHFLDRMLYWFGYPDDFEYQDDSLGGPEANALATFRYFSPSPFDGMVRFSKTVPLKEGFVMETDQGIVVVQDRIRFRPHAHPSLELLVQHKSTGSQGGEKGIFQLQMEDFIEACETGRAPAVSARQALDSLRLIEALYARRSPLKTDVYGLSFRGGVQR